MSMRPFSSFIAVSVLTGIFSVAEPALADAKIAVVDTQRAIMETEDGLRAQATLKKLFDSRQRELERTQANLQKEREDIEKQRQVLSKEALAKRVEQWQKNMLQVQQVFADYNKELQQKQATLTQPIFQKAMALIQQLARRDGYDVVVDKQAVPYVRTDLDLTDRVITLYNQGGAAGATTPTAPAAPAAPPPAGPAPAPKK